MQTMRNVAAFARASFIRRLFKAAVLAARTVAAIVHAQCLDLASTEYDQ